MLNNSFEVDSFLDEQELLGLSKYYQKLPKAYNSGDEKKAYTTGFPWADLPMKKINDKVEQVFGKCNVGVSMFLEEFEPWGVHTDFLQGGDNVPYYAVLIPLDFEDKPTHTIIFDQQATDSDWKEKLTNKTHHPYTDKDLNLLDHIDNDLLDKLSIDNTFKWEKGKLIAWHRNFLHTSDNFKATGMNRKIALVLFLNKDD